MVNLSTLNTIREVGDELCRHRLTKLDIIRTSCAFHGIKLFTNQVTMGILCNLRLRQKSSNSLPFVSVTSVVFLRKSFGGSFN